MTGLGLVLMVSTLYGSYRLAGIIVATNVTAWAVGTAVLSKLVDRFGQRRVMYPATVVSAIALAFTAGFALAGLPIWTLFLPALIAGGTAGSPGALVRARWNYVLDDDDQLHTAFSLESALDEVNFVVGPVLATALATWVHPVAGVAASVVFTLVGAVLFYPQRATEPPISPQAISEHQHPSLALMIPGVTSVVVIGVLLGAIFGSIDVSVVASATAWDVRPASGVILAAFSLASGTAGFVYGARSWTSPSNQRFLFGVLALFATCLLLPLASNAVMLGLLGVLLGTTIAPTLTNANTIIGQLVPTARITEGLAWMGTGIGIGVSVGSSVAGTFIDLAGHAAGLWTVAGFGTVIALIGVMSHRSLNRDLAAAR